MKKEIKTPVQKLINKKLKEFVNTIDTEKVEKRKLVSTPKVVKKNKSVEYVIEYKCFKILTVSNKSRKETIEMLKRVYKNYQDVYITCNGERVASW